jgi:hypothetical protein
VHTCPPVVQEIKMTVTRSYTSKKGKNHEIKERGKEKGKENRED